MALIRIHRLQLLVYLLVVLSFISCSRRTPNDLYVVKALKVSIEKLSNEIEKENEMTFASFQLKTQFPETRQKAELFLPSILRIRSITSSLLVDIKNAQFDLRKEATGKDDSEPFYYEDNLDAVKRLFIKKERAAYLFRKLNSYKTQLEGIDSSNRDYVSRLLIDMPKNETELKNLDNFLEFFKHQPAIAADAFLESLKADILLNEKRMLSFITGQIASHPVHYTSKVLTGTNVEQTGTH